MPGRSLAGNHARVFFVFAEHCPKHCSHNNPPPSEVIGVAALAQPDILIEIVAVAALPD
jgi:enamine deaminase RidA (YjgF/YER057c/UK114 family)